MVLVIREYPGKKLFKKITLLDTFEVESIPLNKDIDRLYMMKVLYREGKSYKEIAQAVGSSQGYVRVLLKQMLKITV